MSAPGMRHMRDKVEQQLKPMLKMLRAGMLPHGRLLAGGVELVIAHYERMFRVMDERSTKLCWYEFCLTPEVFLAMGIQPFLGETHPSMMALGTPEVCWDYVDTAEQRGIPPELCVLDKFLLGALVRDELPRADFIVTASAPCDSSRIGYQMFEQLTDCSRLPPGRARGRLSGGACLLRQRDPQADRLPRGADGDTLRRGSPAGGL